MSLAAQQLLARGIRVNAEAPGKEVASFGAGSDMGRPAQPEEIAPAHAYLEPPVMSSYVRGVALPVMGGSRG